jgi:hypothetical protein
MLYFSRWRTLTAFSVLRLSIGIIESRGIESQPGKSPDQSSLSQQPAQPQVYESSTDDFEKMMKGRQFPCKRTIDLKPGSYNPALGVVDRNSRLMGTTAWARVP